MNLDGYTVTDVTDPAERFRMCLTEGLGYPAPPVWLVGSNAFPGTISVRFPVGVLARDVPTGRALWRARSLVGLPQPLCEDCFASAYAEARTVREACQHADHLPPAT